MKNKMHASQLPQVLAGKVIKEVTNTDDFDNSFVLLFEDGSKLKVGIPDDQWGEVGLHFATKDFVWEEEARL